jgi:putative radical SAM enzyme (TIGR03279 family)
MQIRNRMLGNPKASDIMKELKFFADNKIRMHVQIVLCPGYNDGKELQSTIRDIYRFYPYILSIAVVPVGLTRHRRTQLNPVSRDDARHALAITEAFQKRFKKKHGETLVYAADEMFIKAEMPFPPLKEYGELSQIENGVGMVPLFTSQMRRLKLPESFRKDRRFLTFTGTSFYPYLKKLTDRLRDRESCPIDLVSVENKFFGPSVSVTGLLTGRDIISAIHGNTDHYDVLIVPDVVLREGDTLLLDNVSLADLEYATGLKVITTDCTPQGLIDTITGEA